MTQKEDYVTSVEEEKKIDDCFISVETSGPLQELFLFLFLFCFILLLFLFLFFCFSFLLITACVKVQKQLR